MKILLTGGTGLIGRSLVVELIRQGHFIVLYTRDKTNARQRFEAPCPHFDAIIDCLDDVDFNKLDAVINLAGEPIVDKRWTEKQKQVLCDSRWLLTRDISSKILAAETPPSVFISGSAIGVYGRQGETHVDESLTDFYPEFSSKLCLQWEKYAGKADTDKTRVCLLRTGIVLSEKGGALAKMLPAFRLGLGGPISHGQQAMSWVHIQDMVAMIIFLLEQPELRGAFNMTSPNPVSNKTFSKTLASTLNKPCIFKVPAWVLKLAMGEMSDLLIYGQYVYPQKLEDAGYVFRHPQLKSALNQLLQD